MRLWVDECLSPALVQAAQRRCEATCNEHRGLLHVSDPILYKAISEEEWVLVTNNQSDFLTLAAQAGLHCGLILLPQRLRAEQPPMLDAVLDYIDRNSAKAGMAAAAWMTNRVI